MIRFGTIFIVLLLNATLFSQNSKKPMKELLSDYSYQTKTILIDGVEIKYMKEGNGKKTLLFVHGLSSNSEAWAKNIETLRKHYTCIALDLPGYGKSSKPDVAYTPTYFAEVVHQFIGQLDLKNIVLIGHSMGGQASIKLALNYPDVIKKLILVAPAGLEQFTAPNAAFMKAFFTLESVKNTPDAQIEKNYALNFYKQPEDVHQMINDRKQIKEALDFEAHCQAIVRSISGMLDEPVSANLEDISQSTLVIFGDQDMLIPNRYFNPDLTIEAVGEIALEKIPTVKLELIKDAGHFVHYEKPKEVNLRIQQFIEE
tara:strand:+ start:212735 stop:213676 length:942 start_codon:yes stop_codon:yes gene_type:complete